MKTMPVKQEVYVGDKRFYIVHGCPRNPLYGYLRPDMSREDLINYLRETPLKKEPVKADYVVVGHTHIAFKLEVMGRTVVNPGSVGQPRDGDPRASYMIVDLGENSVRHYRVKYDIDNVVAKPEKLSLEHRYLEWLKNILYKAVI